MNAPQRPSPTLRAIAASPARAAGRKWYRFENAAADDVAELYIYGEVGFWGTGAEQFSRELRAITAAEIHVHINSPGGDVFEGIAIHNALKQHPATVTVFVDALAASIASVIAMAGDVINIAQSAYLMIHDPWGLGIGDAAELRKLADLLDKIQGTIADVYAARGGGMSADEFKQLMAKETWFTAAEAIDAGLADNVTGDDDGATAQDKFDLSLFARVPPKLKAANAGRRPASGAPKTKREVEDVLRDAGLSNAAAKAIVAVGFKDKSDPRDEDGELPDPAAVRAQVAANIATLSPAPE